MINAMEIVQFFKSESVFRIGNDDARGVIAVRVLADIAKVLFAIEAAVGATMDPFLRILRSLAKTRWRHPLSSRGRHRPSVPPISRRCPAVSKNCRRGLDTSEALSSEAQSAGTTGDFFFDLSVGFID